MKRLQELTLFDKFLFDETMDIPEAHEAVLQIILGDEHLKLLTPTQTEKEFRTAPWLRSIRLDVFAMDQNDWIYNTESQKEEKKDLIKRSRFYQSLIDSSLLAPGDVSFNLMKNTCIIMITPFDLFGKGKYRYTFRTVCEEDPSLTLEDGAMRIFLNSHGTNKDEVSKELVELLNYMEHTDSVLAEQSENEKLKKLHRYVSQIKASEEIGVKYMQRWEERILDQEKGRAEGRAEGLSAGRTEGKRSAEISIIRRQMKAKQKDATEISDILGLAPDYVNTIINLLKAYPDESDWQIAARILQMQS